MFIIDFIIFAFVLGVVVFVHELGHFLAAKKSGVMVEEFGVGFPPKIWKKKIGETEYFIGAIPFGGMTRIYGMDEIDSEKENNSKGYESKGTWPKLLICAGGVIMNIIFAAVIFYFLVAASGFQVVQPLFYSEYKFPFGNQENHVMIAGVDTGSPAELVGLKKYDVVSSINGESMDSADEFISIVSDNKGKEITIGLINGEELKVVPRIETSETIGPLGVQLRDTAILKYNSVPEKIFVGFLHTWNITDYSFSALGKIFSYSVKEKSIQPLASSMTGPVGIFAITKLTAERGLYEIFNLIAILSVALGVSNLIPIPAMDGAKIIFTCLQAANKKVFSKELQMRIETFGALFIIFLAIVMVFKDFIQFKDIILK
ncbi:MAG: M50 family metallopeptidase [Candidatus Pacebacteria bacterium]|nr:M50 family metallopeptidase [Candidatus Paceibacterota bacterium]